MFETSVLFNNLVQTEPPHDKGKWLSWQKFKPLLVPLLITSGVACVAVGMWLYFKVPEVGDTVILDRGVTSTSFLYIDVSGAVEKPGVYQVPEGERITAAIAAAGGLASLADTEYLSSTLNLSARLKDEQKIYIPFVGEREKVENSSSSLTSVIDETTQNSNSLISINSASETQLDSLPRIGVATAQKIIEGRPYLSIEELVSKKVLGQSVLTEIQSLIKL